MLAALALSLVLAPTQQTDQQKIIDEFSSFLAIPNVASDKENIGRNADAIVAMFAKRGIDARLLRIEGAPPIVVADWKSPSAKETIAFYAHYDGQPVDPAQWATPPWQPVIVRNEGDDRIYARSSGDDKGTIIAMLAAIDRLQAKKRAPSINVKFVFEGEEEAGSPHLAAYLEKFASDLNADAWMLCDGPVHQSRKMQLYFGARGVTDVEITTYGPLHPLHSGHYGNWSPNPIVALTHLIDSMRDNDAHILIPHFYDDIAPLTEAERAALREIPNVDDDLKRELALGRTEGASLNEQILKPALNLRGINGGHVGKQASNTINSEAQASIDFRLVPNQTPDSVRRLVEDFLTSSGHARRTRERGEARLGIRLSARAHIARFADRQACRQSHLHRPRLSSHPHAIPRRKYSDVPLPARRKDARNRTSNRESRRQPARRERESAPAESVGRHRCLHRAFLESLRKRVTLPRSK